MKERPIVFNTEMIQVILDDRKTQTRRVIKPQFLNPTWTGTRWVESGNDNTVHFEIKCPYGKIGDRLWVRETWCAFVKEHIIDSPYVYKSDMRDAESEECRQEYIRLGYPYQWKSPIFMPRIASRITLEITDIRVERVQDIPEREIFKEGITPANWAGCNTDKEILARLWNSINYKRGYSWESNPWVWVIQFKNNLT